MFDKNSIFVSNKGKNSYFCNVIFEYHKNKLLKTNVKIMIHIESVK